MSIADQFMEAIVEGVARRLEDKLDRPDGPRLLTIEQAAQYLGYTPAAARHMVAKGQLPCVRNGRTIRFDAADLNRWIEDHKGNGSR
jgi:excisionase family DNA binding protein